jgi:hypothetical protein
MAFFLVWFGTVWYVQSAATDRVRQEWKGQLVAGAAEDEGRFGSQVRLIRVEDE